MAALPAGAAPLRHAQITFDVADGAFAPVIEAEARARRGRGWRVSEWSHRWCGGESTAP